MVEETTGGSQGLKACTCIYGTHPYMEPPSSILQNALFCTLHLFTLLTYEWVAHDLEDLGVILKHQCLVPGDVWQGVLQESRVYVSCRGSRHDACVSIHILILASVKGVVVWCGGHVYRAFTEDVLLQITPSQACLQISLTQVPLTEDEADVGGEQGFVVEGLQGRQQAQAGHRELRKRQASLGWAPCAA